MQRQLETLEQAFERQDKQAIAKRQQQWHDIQEKAPGLANFLQEMKNAFGKVRLISVEFANNDN